VRFVLAPDGTVTPDVAERLPGRGLWVTAARDIVETAVAKRLFARAARKPATAPSDLAERVERLLAERCRELIGLARRAGQAVAGFEKVREMLRAGRVGLLVEALDGAAHGREKLAGGATGVRQVRVLRGDELGLAFGRDHVVHAAVAPGRFAERLEVDAGRLAGFRRAISGVQGTETNGG
jgi:predicted RNA-binding protein YlxR (DUF448 family)